MVSWYAFDGTQLGAVAALQPDDASGSEAEFPLAVPVLEDGVGAAGGNGGGGGRRGDVSVVETSFKLVELEWRERR